MNALLVGGTVREKNVRKSYVSVNCGSDYRIIADGDNAGNGRAFSVVQAGEEISFWGFSFFLSPLALIFLLVVLVSFSSLFLSVLFYFYAQQAHH